MDSHGCCPVCGHNNKSTVVAAYKKSYRRIAPWWAFWDDRVEFGETCG